MENKTSKKVIALSEALKKARAESLKYKDTEDGGACNFDRPTIRLTRWRQADIEKACELADCGVKFGKWGGWNYYNYHIYGVGYGQGNCRTRMARAFAKSLKASGYEVGMWYAVD